MLLDSNVTTSTFYQVGDKIGFIMCWVTIIAFTLMLLYATVKYVKK
ncbi:hypothetical protein MKQ68_22095 [Chitinophaga horti]|uniref:CcmD family protein n=1 Tax=Chitinophaga horti TaxID=2920382 RepID=A0ABY6IZH4_9BACT|nr:hypothetical protein [Chitinophaga horti]UYQ92775.1 hypothetical protein MKQ68_22095 [Chitinophaga horti]